MEPCLALLLSLLPAQLCLCQQSTADQEWTTDPQSGLVSPCTRVSMKENLAFKVNSLWHELLCLFDGLWVRRLSYLNSASESVLRELFFLLHSPGTLMLLQTWNYGDVCRDQESGWIQVFQKQSLQCWIEPWEKSALQAQDVSQSRVQSRLGQPLWEDLKDKGKLKQGPTQPPLVSLCRELSSTNNVPYILWKYSSLKEPSEVLPQRCRNREGNGATVWPIDSPHLSFLLTWELKVLLQEMEERASYYFQSCLPFLLLGECSVI